MTVHDLIVEQKEVSGGEYVGVINTVVDEVMKITELDPFEVPMEIYTTIDLENKIISIKFTVVNYLTGKTMWLIWYCSNRC